MIFGKETITVLFTICGRAGSKGIKNKNIMEFDGKPLPLYSISAIDLFLSKYPEINSDIVISSDSPILLDLMNNNTLRHVELIQRDKSLSGDQTGKVAVIKNCLEKMEKRRNIQYDVIVDFDITSPLRRVCDIEKLFEVHFANNPDVTTSVTRARRNPYFNQVMKTEKGVKQVIKSNYTSRQQAPEIFDMNASLYAYSPEYLRTGKGVLDGYCEIIEMNDTGVIDLDNENDFELMEVIAEFLYNKYPDFCEIRDNIRLSEKE